MSVDSSAISFSILPDLDSAIDAFVSYNPSQSPVTARHIFYTSRSMDSRSPLRPRLLSEALNSLDRNISGRESSPTRTPIRQALPAPTPVRSTSYVSAITPRERKRISPLSSLVQSSTPQSPVSPLQKVMPLQKIDEYGDPIIVTIPDPSSSLASPTKELLVRNASSTYPKSTIIVPAQIHQDDFDRFLVRAKLEGLQEASSYIWRKMDNVIREQNKAGFKRALQFVWDNCIASSSSSTDDHLVARELSPNGRNLIHTLLYERPYAAEPPLTWSPPPFLKVDQYCRDLVENQSEIIILGHLDGQKIKLVLVGFVECWDEDDDLTGRTLLKLKREDMVTEVLMKVLGHVYATGTAVLLDEQGNVWLYQTPNATAPQLRGFHHTAAIILKAGDVAAIEKELHLEDMYTVVEHDLIESEEEDYPSYEDDDVSESDL